jgi:hypothetical protein
MLPQTLPCRQDVGQIDGDCFVHLPRIAESRSSTPQTYPI